MCLPNQSAHNRRMVERDRAGQLRSQFRSATDPQAVLPSETMLTTGISNIDFTMLTPGNQKLRVAGASNPAFADTSNSFPYSLGVAVAIFRDRQRAIAGQCSACDSG
ncbi:MAG: hypothetical protein R3C26_21195 [Calditrichia bacterium]